MLPDGRAADVLGELRAWGGVLVIRTREGADVEVAVADVVAAKRIPAAVPRDRDVLALERAAAAGWPGLEQHRIGGWLLRAGGGFTGRANSALALGDPGMPVGDALTAVEEWYAERGLPGQFQVPLPAGRRLDRVLAERGYTVHSAAHVLVGTVAALAATSQRGAASQGSDLLAVRLDTAPDDAWLARYHYRGGALPPQASAVLRAVDGTVVFASARRGESTLAICRGAVAHGWLGVTALEVAPEAQRQGLGTLLLRGIADWAAGQGAARAYLQVATDNATAAAFYDRLGVVRHHTYHYRRAASTASG